MKTVKEWLTSIGLEKYEVKFGEAGYDDLEFLGPEALDENDLNGIGVTQEEDGKRILESLSKKGFCPGMYDNLLAAGVELQVAFQSDRSKPMQRG